MSSNEDPKLLAGHPPAVKAGGMRIARTHRSSAGESKTEMTKEEIEEYGTGSPPKGNKDVVISGAVVKEKDAFPPEAVKRFHEASLPAKEQRPVERSHHIHQPRDGLAVIVHSDIGGGSHSDEGSYQL